MARRSPASERTRPGPGAGLPPPDPGAPGPGAAVASHYALCYGCGEDHPTGLHLQAVVGEGLSLSAQLRVTQDHQGAPGLAHGGVLAAALDEALGMLLWLLRRPAVTVRLETDFRSPVPVGSVLHLAARCTGVEGRKVYTEAEGRLGGPDGAVVVAAAALFVEVPAEHFAPHAPAGTLPPGLQQHNP